MSEYEKMFIVLYNAFAEIREIIERADYTCGKILSESHLPDDKKSRSLIIKELKQELYEEERQKALRKRKTK